ncbi:WhiB family transcriptional regulator [Actinomadura luteofluorescens]|uniref:WhiB family transcriptional regulator n=1 Tax=Actinomadura luteofluorescens TaxID=46163 RepID=UPI003D8CEB8E
MTAAQDTARLSRSTFDRRDWAWQERAACRGEGLALFFGPATGDDREYPPAKRDREAEAKWICGLCEVRTDCLEYALDAGEKYGIFGGLNEEERKRFRRAKSARERKARKDAAA